MLRVDGVAAVRTVDGADEHGAAALGGDHAGILAGVPSIPSPAVRPARHLLALAALALPLAGCGDDRPAAERRDDLVDDLAGDLVEESGGDLTPEAARCVAGRLADGVGVERFEALVRAAAEDDDPELKAQVVDAFASCDALEPLLDEG